MLKETGEPYTAYKLMLKPVFDVLFLKHPKPQFVIKH